MSGLAMVLISRPHAYADASVQHPLPPRLSSWAERDSAFLTIPTLRRSCGGGAGYAPPRTAAFLCRCCQTVSSFWWLLFRPRRIDVVRCGGATE